MNSPEKRNGSERIGNWSDFVLVCRGIGDDVKLLDLYLSISDPIKGEFQKEFANSFRNLLNEDQQVQVEKVLRALLRGAKFISTVGELREMPDYELSLVKNIGNTYLTTIRELFPSVHKEHARKLQKQYPDFLNSQT